MEDSSEAGFVAEEVNNIIKESLDATLGNQTYHQSKINTWTTNVVEAVLNSLAKLNKPFKYIVSCVIMQNNGAGLHTASSCFWDGAADGTTSFTFVFSLCPNKFSQIFSFVSVGKRTECTSSLPFMPCRSERNFLLFRFASWKLSFRNKSRPTVI